MRFNAMIPGFSLTDWNRSLPSNYGGSYTERAHSIVVHTPSGS
jgi:hypothetical protein